MSIPIQPLYDFTTRLGDVQMNPTTRMLSTDNDMMQEWFSTQFVNEPVVNTFQLLFKNNVIPQSVWKVDMEQTIANGTQTLMEKNAPNSIKFWTNVVEAAYGLKST